MRQRKLFLVIGLAVVAILICAALFLPNEGLPRSQTLQDGSVLKVEAVMFGTNLTYRETPPKAWQLAIGRRLPFVLTERLGWRFKTDDWRSIGLPDGRTALGIFAIHEGPGKAEPDELRVVVLDDEGNSLGLSEWGGGGSGTDQAGTHYHKLHSWWIPAFPRRAKTLVVRFLRRQGGGKADMPIMQFHVPNPQLGKYPAWTPEPWPATKSADDLIVTLTDFTTGLSLSQPTKAAIENEEAATRLALNLEANGQTNFPWQINTFEISDATSNRWIPDMPRPKIELHHEHFTSTMVFRGNLWPGESAWKVRIELAPKPGLPFDKLATLTNIVIPPIGLNSPLAQSVLTQSTNMGDFSLRLQSIARGQPSAKSKSPTLHVTIAFNHDEVPEDCRLNLVKVSDERSRPIKINGSGELKWRSSFELDVPTNAVSLNCTFGVRKSRFVEFIAKPRTPRDKTE